MSQLKKQNGIGILQIILVSAVFFGFILMVSRMLDKKLFLTDLRAKNQSHDLFVKTLNAQLSDPSICSLALAGQPLNATLNTKQPLDKIQLSYGLTPGPITPNWESKDTNSKITKIEIVLNRQALMSDSAIPPTTKPRNIIFDWPNLGPTPNSFKKFYGNLYFHFSDERWNPLADGRPIELAFLINPTTNQIHQCHGTQSIAEACESLGGAYDVSNRSKEELRCNPDMACFNHKMGLVKNKTACPEPYVAVEVGRIDGEINYLCTWCNRNH